MQAEIVYACRQCNDSLPARAVLLVRHARQHGVPVASCFVSSAHQP